MSSNNVITPDSLKYQRHIYAFEALMQEAFRRMGVYKILIYFVDTVDAGVLPYLAEEFDVLGIKGWEFADTEAKQRQLIKEAIELHRKKGTPWAVEQVMFSLNLTDPELIENYGGEWWQFAIEVDYNTNSVDVAMLELGYRLVKVYKNTRSVFMGFVFTGLNFGDSMTMGDTNLTTNGDGDFGDTINTQTAFLRNGTQTYNGLRNHAQDTDTLTVNII